MERARLLLADERLEKTTDPDAYSGALESAREAEVLAMTPGAPAESLGRARALIEEVARGRERAAADRTMAERLRGLRLHFSDVQRAGSEARTWSLARHRTGTPATWNELAPAAAPSQRMDHQMIRTGDGSILLFGGTTALRGPLLNDTWSWDGAGWTELAPATAPPVRSGHAMSYDPARDRVVLFSGAASPVGTVLYHADTWEWDGSNWRLMSPTHSPPRRDWAGMAYDPHRGATILFGGRDSMHKPTGKFEPYGDTWAWDGEDWTRLSPETSPPARHGARLVLDGNLGQLVLAGGQFPRAPGFDDTWAWDGEDWRKLAPSTTYAGRAFFAMAFDEERDRMVLHGGKDVTDGLLLADSWEFDGEDWSRAASDGPAYGWFPAAFDERRRAVLVQGGSISATRFQTISDRFAAAFRDYGIDIDRVDATTAAKRVNDSPIREELIYAIDEWIIVGGSSRRADPDLIRVANLVDSNEWRRDVRAAMDADDVDHLRALADTVEGTDVPASSLDLLASCLTIEGDHDAAIRIYRQACLRDPGNFNVHLKLSDLLEFSDSDSADEVLRLVHIAVAVQPDSARALTTLARLLTARGENARAIAYLERAVVAEPDLPKIWHQLGSTLGAEGRYAEARHALEESARQGEWSAEIELAQVLQQLGLLDEAITTARHAISMSPGKALPHTVLGAILLDGGRVDEAISALQESLRRNPLGPSAHFFLGRALIEEERFADARSSLLRSLELTNESSTEQAAVCKWWLAVVDRELAGE